MNSKFKYIREFKAKLHKLKPSNSHITPTLVFNDSSIQYNHPPPENLEQLLSQCVQPRDEPDETDPARKNLESEDPDIFEQAPRQNPTDDEPKITNADQPPSVIMDGVPIKPLLYPTILRSRSGRVFKTVAIFDDSHYYSLQASISAFVPNNNHNLQHIL